MEFYKSIREVKQALAPMKKGSLRVIIRDGDGRQEAYEIDADPLGNAIATIIIGGLEVQRMREAETKKTIKKMINKKVKSC